MSTQSAAFDYIVVGSGAGGGPLAANLARAGFEVLLLEAGGDPLDMPDAAGAKTRSNYLVPALHGRSTEDINMRWDFFVQHYTKDPSRRLRTYDSKYDERKGGIWYPRAGTLGGCTAHNAMITVYPHDRDWDDLAQELGDDSWSAANMRRCFERLERCRYRPPGTPGHGAEGWLSTELPDPRLAFGDVQLLKAILGAALEVLESKGQDPFAILAPILSELEPMLSPAEKMLIATLRSSQGGLKSLETSGASGVLGLLEGPIRALKAQIHAVALELIGHLLSNDAALKILQKKLDPNAPGAVDRGGEGLYMIPLATDGGRRNGTREVIERAKAESGGNLTVRTGVLVTRVLFDDDESAGTLGKAAVGVEFIPRPHMYRADPTAASLPTPSAREQQFARREVILSAGAFNTPQLLMLSGIGPRADVERFRRADDPGRPAIPCRVDLPGVGQNLQDRYEVGVISEMTSDFSALRGCQFEAPLDPANATDPCYEEWEQGRGVYTTNGAVISVVLRSSVARAQGGDPDLFLFGLAGYFKGYFQTYSHEIEGAKNHFTWAILKAHTRNRAGTVRLRSADPRDTPEIDFAYFDEGSPGWEADLQAVAEGVDFVREMTRNSDVFVKSELLPGGDIDDPEEVRRFVMKEAWGHHACGTCKMGPDGDPTAVLDKDFKVRGIDNLRVVDASVFPRIPGFFIVTPIYMISEKASRAILDRTGTPGPSVAG